MKTTHFARVNTRAQVLTWLNALEAIIDDPAACLRLTKGSMASGFIQVLAPNGDCVFAALEKAPNTWVCRFHREVFHEGAD